MAATFCISVTKNPSEHHLEILVNNLLKRCDIHSTWQELFVDICNANKLDVGEGVSVTVGCSSTNNGEVLHPELDQPISTAIEFANIRYVSFVLKDDGRVLKPPLDQENAVNAFDVLMGALKQPAFIPRKTISDSSTAKDRLFNDVADDLEKDGPLFNTSTADQMYHISNIVNTLWYLDGNKNKLQERAKTSAEVRPLPERFYNRFNGYNDWKRKRKKGPRLDSSSLKSYAQALFHTLSKPVSSSWNPNLRDSLQELALAMDTYAEYLKISVKQQTNRQNSLFPSRQVARHCWIRHHISVSEDASVEDMYSNLDLAMCALNEFEPVFFDEDIHISQPFKNRTDRFRFFEDLHLSVPVDVLRYDPGGACGTTVFVWRVPPERDSSSMMTSSSRIVKTLESRLPEYHTRSMRKQFAKDYSCISGSQIQPQILRAIYADVALDSSADRNPSLDNRIRQAILAEDPDLVTDLRHLNNGRPADTFDVFFDKLDEKVEQMRAADERRHGVEHMAYYISLRDLIKDVTKDCPPGTKIPSESTVLFAFAPRNAHAAVARLYKQRVNLKFKIQTRQLRCSHQDEHYCASLFKYIRTYAVKYKESCTLLCVDDKSKIHFGEPGLAISSGVRGRQSIVPVTSQLAALDHDVSSKGSLTPSVCLNVDIPDKVEGSFYRGEVTVTLKDSIFQASSPFRHGAELIDLLTKQPSIPPVLLIYSDGGPDHRVNYASVKLVMIAIFQSLDLDLIIAARTAPGHSWANPAERVMSVLNLAYQNCALSRKECTADIEGELKNTNSMEDIRKKSTKNSAIKPAWLESVSEMINTLNDRVSKLTLKDIPFKCGKPVDDKVVEELESTVVQAVDPSIEVGKYTKKDLQKKNDFHAFLERHTRERHYMFQVSKCDDRSCCKVRRGSTEYPWMPDPMLNKEDIQHYLPFEKVVGTPTTEEDRPSLQNDTLASVAQDQQGCKNLMLVGQNVRSTVQCYECGKPRCIYSKLKLTVRESRALMRLLTKHDYSCGAMITTDGDALQGKVFVRLQLACNKPIEFPYYSGNHGVGKPDVCCHCGIGGAERSAELSKKYKIVLPVCNDCLAAGKDIPKRQPIK